MELCKTSNFSTFNFLNANDLQFCTHSYSSCVYLLMRFKGSNGKVCKMMTSHFRMTSVTQFRHNIHLIVMGSSCESPANVMRGLKEVQNVFLVNVMQMEDPRWNSGANKCITRLCSGAKLCSLETPVPQLKLQLLILKT